jgi:hypothetical protein
MYKVVSSTSGSARKADLKGGLKPDSEVDLARDLEHGCEQPDPHLC